MTPFRFGETLIHPGLKKLRLGFKINLFSSLQASPFLSLTTKCVCVCLCTCACFVHLHMCVKVIGQPQALFIRFNAPYFRWTGSLLGQGNARSLAGWPTSPKNPPLFSSPRLVLLMPHSFPPLIVVAPLSATVYTL